SDRGGRELRLGRSVPRSIFLVVLAVMAVQLLNYVHDNHQRACRKNRPRDGRRPQYRALHRPSARSSRRRRSGQYARVAQEVRDAGGQAEVYLADVADAAAVKKMVDGVLARFGRIDILVLNASV